MIKRISCGIYKIISPTKRIYIGQSIDIKSRWSYYKRMYESNNRQRKLHRSFKKYGVENHIFEIIEECSEEDLNCRERHWQDEFDVLNGGLNCILQECGEQRRVLSEETRQRKSEASKGDRNGMWNYQYSEEQIEAMRKRMLGENSPSYGKQITKEMQEKRKKTLQDIGYDSSGSNNPNANKVIDTLTKKVYGTQKEVYIMLGVSKGTMIKYLSGKHYNPTTFMLLKDYEEGMIHIPDKQVNGWAPKVEDIITGIKYDSIAEAKRILKIEISYQYLVTLIRKESTKTTLRYITD